MKRNGDPLGTPTRVDYAVMIGGPIVFMLILWFGVNWIVGPGPPPRPIQKLKAGVVKNGMTSEQVIAQVGPPAGIVESPDGSFTYRYQGTGEDAFLAEDAFVDFGAGGRVVNVTFEKTPVKPPGDDKK
ncbi:MAG: hypothetical protein KIS66_16155 [Fimbriimonadaceae bacterium]|nr:hypothetical protein [Fimbriimonadaceae bacterium]